MATEVAHPARRTRTLRTSLRTRIIVLCLLWIVAIVPFVFLRRNTWFGRPLSDQQIGEYLHANDKPKQIVYALGQIGQRMSRHDSSASIWYADLVRLSRDSDENVRATDARVMAEAANLPDLHDALLNQLHDGSGLVRFSAALSLARVSDGSGHGEFVGVLQESRPDPDQVLQVLQGLQQIGQERDLRLVEAFAVPRPDVPERVRQQALLTANSIRARNQQSK